jgi:threonine synthase
MRYKSTRGGVSGLKFSETLLMGLAPDGGLFVPEVIPDVKDNLLSWKDLSFVELAKEVVGVFVDDIQKDVLDSIIEKAYSDFEHKDVVGLDALEDIFVLELFHGPTLAFKDVALQLLGGLFSHILRERKQHLNILGATSGDTGSAAIAGIRGCSNIDIFIMYPDQKVSALQELQMTTNVEPNVHCLAIEGSFDDCQNLMKNIFGDLDFKNDFHLGAINSVNWARIMAQIVYYGYASLRFADGCCFAVPTGNFGNVFAAFLAKKMGFPIDKLIVATNENDILHRFFQNGDYSRGPTHFTLSPAMDIQVASNFERYLYYQSGCDTAQLGRFMDEFNHSGKVTLQGLSKDEMLVSTAVNSNEMLEALRDVKRRSGYLLDPHSAVGFVAANRFLRELKTPMVTVATAHPAKFPDAIEKAGIEPVAVHQKLEKLKNLPTKRKIFAADQALIKGYIKERASFP